jgi:hypothetical protein
MFTCRHSPRDTIPLTVASVAQRWQMETCKAPVHNAGPLTSRIGITLLVIGAVCVGCRFFARWRIQNSSVGWDDWSILVSYILLIPSTILVEISQSIQNALVIPRTNHANFVLLVAHNGMGRDIWTVPFEDITMMLKVSQFSGDKYTETVLRAIGSSPSRTIGPRRSGS